MNVPPGMSFYGWAGDPPHQVYLGPGDPIPDEVMLQLTPDHPLIASQPPVAIEAALSVAQAPAVVVARAALMAAAAQGSPVKGTV